MEPIIEKKGRYHIPNWRDYNKSLIQRGSMTVWFSPDAVNTWLALEKKGKKGHPFLYSKEAILTALGSQTLMEKVEKLSSKVAWRNRNVSI